MMMTSSISFLTSVVSILILSAKVVTAQYSCPGLNADPVVVPAGSGSSFTREINKSSQNTICVLFRITAKSENANLNSITRNSKTEDFNIVPVARSYNNRNWEKVAGPYAQELQVNNCCDVVIPNLSNLENGKFVLLSFSHSLTDREEVSRFFQQTTFGPTMDMINSWNYGNNLMSEMGKWVKRQMNPNQVTPTYHRQYFRERVEFSTYHSSAMYNYRPRHPCDKYARWRKYSFSVEDNLEEISVSLRNGKYLVKKDNVPRTLINPEDWEDEYGQNIGVGNFYVCWTEERLWGSFGVKRDFDSGCYWTRNPPINLPSAVITNHIKEVSLPADTDANFGTIDPIIMPDATEDLYGEDIYLKNTITMNGCSNIPENGDYHHTLGTFPNGNQAWYAGNVVLDSNTLDEPIQDGGAAMMKIANTIDEWREGAQCPVASASFLNIDSCYLSTWNKACSSVYKKSNDGDAVVICGSPGEVSNNPLNRKTFTFYGATNLSWEAQRQKRDVWTMIALRENDQLRQRMAWALSQILVITPNQINDEGYSEIYLNYYDIFVRNAFGNYFDILKEVSYSPMMAEMLSYLDSKSSAYVLQTTGSKSYPDENYAREIMQLFSLGLYKLNMDGTLILLNGEPQLTYVNSDIQNFARAWTGFTRQRGRSNLEAQWWDDDNRMDPMKVNGVYRDPFPKMDLYGGYIGDRKPLCEDLPEKHFLKKGATYHLLGSSLTPYYHEVEWWFEEDSMPDNVLVLPSASNLRNALLSNDVLITLTTDLTCSGRECNVDTLRIVKVQANPPIFYEYVQQPCVEFSFYDTGKKISTLGWDEPPRSMCANKKLAVAYDVCCENASWNGGTELCYYDLEKTTYSTANQRCTNEYPNGGLCDIYWVSSDICFTRDFWKLDKWYWTNQDCNVKAKVNEDGMIAIVHQPSLFSNSEYSYSIDLRVHPDNTNYFKVKWDSSSYPKASNSCGNGACQAVYQGCLCDITIQESRVFDQLPSANAIKAQLNVGAFDPEILGSYSKVPNTGNVGVWHKYGTYDKNTIFQVNYRGKQTYFKNVESIVKIDGAGFYNFRNPPSFLNLGFREPRDAIYETEAVLENYFFHDNVAPFLAKRLIQRFGISNPSPGYVENVANAFQTGVYPNPDSQGNDFGDGNYGNLEAMVAAIVLDSEARSSILDADPTSGSLAEPLIKLMRFMRAMEFQGNEDLAGEKISLVNLQPKIAQEAHSSPSVFSFFLNDYAAPGHIKSAKISSPEAQILSGPKIINFMNGIISLVELGLTECYSGFGEPSSWWCEGFESYYNGDERIRGKLTYSSSTPNNAASVVDDLSLLLTGGRLNSDSRSDIRNAYINAANNAEGLRLAQKLMAATPEFHSSNLYYRDSEDRPQMEAPPASNRRYKAVVFLFLGGGIDSYNILVPHSGCNGGKTSYNHYSSVRGAIAVPQNELNQIDASSSSQVCSKFGIHPNLPHLKSLYDSGDLLWVANMGVLQEKVTKDNWWAKTDKTALFAHNIQTEEVGKMDIFDRQAGRGVGGRMVDALIRNGWSSGAVSIKGIPISLVSTLGQLIVLSGETGLEKLNPIPWAERILRKVRDLTKSTVLGTGLFAETWANLLYKAFGENEILFDSIRSSSLSTTFPDSDLGKQMEIISRLIKTKDDRGSERDVFYAEMGGYDTHDSIKTFLDERTEVLNSGIQAFTTEMKNQGKWDDVTVVMVSEFARTLAGNTGEGSDHAWGGNYFIAGGEIKGKRILGEYPNILSNDGPLVFEPGIVIPTLSWDSVWNGIAQWFGVTNENDLDEVLPNRNAFSNDLFNQNDLYTSGTPPTPTPPSSCTDTSLRLKVIKNDGSKIMRDCAWVSNKPGGRCSFDGVALACPNACNTCDTCEDSTVRFKIIKNDGSKIMRDCAWVSNKAGNRCNFDGVSLACRAACGTC